MERLIVGSSLETDCCLSSRVPHFPSDPSIDTSTAATLSSNRGAHLEFFFSEAQPFRASLRDPSCQASFQRSCPGRNSKTSTSRSPASRASSRHPNGLPVLVDLVSIRSQPQTLSCSLLNRTEVSFSKTPISVSRPRTTSLSCLPPISEIETSPALPMHPLCLSWRGNIRIWNSRL